MTDCPNCAELQRRLSEAQMTITKLREALDEPAIDIVERVMQKHNLVRGSYAERLDKDAARYRFLRDEEYTESLLNLLRAAGIHKNEVDAAVDAAIAYQRAAPARQDGRGSSSAESCDSAVANLGNHTQAALPHQEALTVNPVGIPDDEIEMATEEVLIAYANATPALLSCLYELDLMPEQCDGGRDEEMMLTIANHWRENEIARRAFVDIDAEDRRSLSGSCEEKR